MSEKNKNLNAFSGLLTHDINFLHLLISEGMTPYVSKRSIILPPKIELNKIMKISGEKKIDEIKKYIFKSNIRPSLI